MPRKSDKPEEIVATAVQEWIGAVGEDRLHHPRLPVENGFIESFNARLARRTARW